MRMLLFSVVFMACGEQEKTTYQEETQIIVQDADGDGFTSDEDCDDNNLFVYPGATENCDGVDNNCDGTTDEGVTITSYLDTDGDGFGNVNGILHSCEVPTGYVPNGNDCDDTENSVFPSAPEICDGLDNNCNDDIDEGLGDAFYTDADGDGFGDSESLVQSCTEGVGYVENGEDCDDSNYSINPLGTEICDGRDNDCNGQTDEDVGNVYFVDADGDGFGDGNNTLFSCEIEAGLVSNDQDCNDDPQNQGELAFPNAPEICDEVDNDCDGQIDENVGTIYYADEDEDGFGDPLQPFTSCTEQSGQVSNNADCDDTDANKNPNVVEICDEVDNDCDLLIDENVTQLFFEDLDADGFGNIQHFASACSLIAGYANNSQDCDDEEELTNPNASETCDEVDNDCDGVIDEGVTKLFFVDADGDGFGTVTEFTNTCEGAIGFVANADDCDDDNILTNPDTTETCDDIDNDCDGQIDEGVKNTFYEDLDADGFGNLAVPVTSCTANDGFVENADDCNDDEAQTNPNFSEICDDLDNDCDGAIDEGMTKLFFIDEDQDGFGNPETYVSKCSAPDGYVVNADDCDDTANLTNPDTIEVCDEVDNDCDGAIDEGVKKTFYLDDDEDGFGGETDSTLACVAPAKYVANSNDCNDGIPEIYPGAVEICDDIDNDCDGAADEGLVVIYYQDNDGDQYGDPTLPVESCGITAGLVDNNDDCDDENDQTYPMQDEICDDIDNDCNGKVDEGALLSFYIDSDEDGFGSKSIVRSCTQPIGTANNDDDCNDLSAVAYPGNTETCDYFDNDCDGQVDDGVSTSYYIDSDGDGFGDKDATPTQGCYPPSGYVFNNDDCDDSSVVSYPDATEICDDIDNNCDGLIDNEAADFISLYRDADNDGFGDSNDSIFRCSSTVGYVTNELDCIDDDNKSNPNGIETCDSLDNDCDGATDENFKTDGKYSSDEHCGSCNNSCTTSTEHAVGYCDDSGETPTCNVVCEEGYIDANSDATDGCECFFVSDNDLFFDGIDSNCDGNDGDNTQAIHVSINGDDTADGSKNTPVQTIQKGIDLALANGKTYVLVAEGTYEENATLQEGIELLGGMKHDFSTRSSLLYPTIIQSPNSQAALQIIDVQNEMTVVEGFYIEGNVDTDGSATPISGSSSIAIYINNSNENLIVRDNFISSANAEDGSDGMDGSNGVDGTDGADGAMSGAVSSNCNTSLALGGAGGFNTCNSTDVHGGDGGDLACPTNGATQNGGSSGLGDVGGDGGAGSCDGKLYDQDPKGNSTDCTCLVQSCWSAGFAGNDGNNGDNGSGGEGSSSSGSWNGTTWQTTSAQDGTLGDNGSGGGGGGVGSGVELIDNQCGSNSQYGATGGGGGAGGCGGNAGTGGNGGGSSFGILLECTNCTTWPTLTDNIIESGTGGIGGSGGNGGIGGLGGYGGSGGLKDGIATCTNVGGAGGAGGKGGSGGAGGGGAGGLSYAIYTISGTPDIDYTSNNDLDASLPGLGGRGGRAANISADGTDGSNGTAGDTNW